VSIHRETFFIPSGHPVDATSAERRAEMNKGGVVSPAFVQVLFFPGTL